MEQYTTDGVQPADLLIADAQPVGDPRPVVLDHHVSLGRQPLHELLTLWLAQIDTQMFLARVLLGKAQRNAVRLGYAPAQQIAFRRLHLDDLGPIVGQGASACRARDPPASDPEQ